MTDLLIKLIHNNIVIIFQIRGFSILGLKKDILISLLPRGIKRQRKNTQL